MQGPLSWLEMKLNLKNATDMHDALNEKVKNQLTNLSQLKYYIK